MCGFFRKMWGLCQEGPCPYMGTLDHSCLSTDPKAYPPFPDLSHLHDGCLANMDFRELLNYTLSCFRSSPKQSQGALLPLVTSWVQDTGYLRKTLCVLTSPIDLGEPSAELGTGHIWFSTGPTVSSVPTAHPEAPGRSPVNSQVCAHTGFTAAHTEPTSVILSLCSWFESPEMLPLFHHLQDLTALTHDGSYPQTQPRSILDSLSFALSCSFFLFPFSSFQPQVLP